MTILHVGLLLLALPALLACGYLLLLTLLSAALPLPARSSRTLRFDIVVPAHDEAAVIERSIASLHGIDWPGDRFRLLVVADNCSDATATLAAAAGAMVLERREPGLRGKGYALQFAFRASRMQGYADAVVVVDADAEVSPNLLEAYAARIEAGAEAVQANYGVLNPLASWRTRLLTIAHASFHTVRSRARERLKLSCGLRGNGWCVTHGLLDRVPYSAFSLAEDLEYGIALGLAGHRVHYAGEANADAEMVCGERVASTQRQRWEHGRLQLMCSRSLPLLAAAARRRSAVCLDLALDLLVLPLSYVALNLAALMLIAGTAALWQPSMQVWLWLGSACGAALALYVLRGWQLSGLGVQGLADLAAAPLFLLWRLLILLRRHEPAGWVSTKRERP